MPIFPNNGGVTILVFLVDVVNEPVGIDDVLPKGLEGEPLKDEKELNVEVFPLEPLDGDNVLPTLAGENTLPEAIMDFVLFV